MRAMLLFPSSGGGVAARSVNSCEATLDAQTGWSEMCLTTPSAPIKGCLRRNFLEVASTPPLEEGNSTALRFRHVGQHPHFREGTL